MGRNDRGVVIWILLLPAGMLGMALWEPLGVALLAAFSLGVWVPYVKPALKLLKGRRRE